MKRTLCCLALLLLVPSTRAADDPDFTRIQDVVYGRKFGTALTLDVFTPKQNANGLGVIVVVSGGWLSSHEGIPVPWCRVLAKHGYTSFAVVHGSGPRYTVPDAVADLRRSVRFVRAHAKDYHIDPDHLGVIGGSAGGHLSLMLGTAGDDGKADAPDPIERVSDRVQAVACWFPPTDFLNYGAKDKDMIQSGVLDLLKLRAAFDFEELDPATRRFHRITDEKKMHEIMRQVSPITHVAAGNAPTLILHGDKDNIVPLQQAQDFVARLKEAGVPVELTVKPGAGHGWQKLEEDVNTFAAWFDKYLKKGKDGKE